VVEERVKYYVDLVQTDATLAQRLTKVGYLPHEDAVRLGAVGPTGRASGVDRDIRRDDPYFSYDQVQFQVVTDAHEDVYGRTLVRVGELLQSLSIIRQIARSMPDGPVKAKVSRKIPAGEATVRYEAPRGENLHYVRSTGGDKPDRVKVRAPTLANSAAVAKMMEHNNLADVPVIIAAIDPCFSCTDRAIRVDDLSRGSSEVLTWKELRRRSVDWWREQGGVDFTAHNQALLKKLAAR
jgi:NADH-quinone oxidoreductase subunit D